MNKKFLIFLSSFLSLNFFVFSQNLSESEIKIENSENKMSVKEIVNPEYYDELIEKGLVRIIHQEAGAEFVLFPNVEYKNEVSNHRVPLKDNKMYVISESLFYRKKTDVLKANNSSLTDIDVQKMSEIFRSFSKMEGLTYWSINNNKEKLLYKESFTIDGPKTKKRIPDQNTGNPDGQILYFYNNDGSFGKCYYQMNLKMNENCLYTSFSTTDSISFAFIKAVEENDLIINTVFADCGDSFVVFFATDTACAKFPGLQDRIENSLVARMDALFKWFLSQF